MNWNCKNNYFCAAEFKPPSCSYLPSFPYQDNALLHVYAGLLCMYIGQPNSERTILLAHTTSGSSRFS
jgi:hypothetical protein